MSFRSELDATENDYYRTKGYYLVSDHYGLSVKVQNPASHSLYYQAIQLRRYMRNALDTLLPEDCAALCKAVLVGDKYAMDQDTRDSFRYAGASYFVVVSGMHFAIIVLIVTLLLKRLKNRWIRMSLLLIFMLLYAAVTGFQPSVLRAGIMAAITAVGVALRWQRYPLNNLGLAGVVLPFVVSPYGAGDIGLILSFYATLAILLWAEAIAHKICFKNEYGSILYFNFGAKVRTAASSIFHHDQKNKKKSEPRQPFDVRLCLKKCWNLVGLMLSVSLAANILVFPISVFVFHAFSLVTILSALLLYVAIYWILILSLMVCILFFMGPLRYVAILLTWILYVLCRWVLWIVDAIGSLPFSYIRVSDSFFYIWLITTILMVIVAFLYRDHRRSLKIAALCSLIILLSGSIVCEIMQSQVFSLEVYACENGICAGINRGGRLYLLQMDADSRSVYHLLDELSSRYDGAQTALCYQSRERENYQRYSQDEFAISSVLLYDKDDKGKNEKNLTFFDDDAVFVLADDITVSVSVIDHTAVPYVTAGDTTILIVPSRCEFDKIPEDFRHADVILLSSASAGMENLRCDELIVSDKSDFAPQTAYALKACYHHVTFTDQGDVHVRLR